MAEIDIDTDKLKDICKDFNSATKNVNSIINDAIYTINSLIERGVWIGPAAERFISLTKPEQMTMQLFCNYINSYTSYIDSVCNKYDGMYNKYRRDDEDTY